MTKTILQATGILLLLILAAIYKGEQNGKIIGMTVHWWGILGLIGWSYLLASTVFLFAKERFGWLTAALVFFLFFNIAANAGWLKILNPIKPIIWFVGDGSLPSLTMAGVITSVLYRKFAHHEKLKQYTFTMLLFGAGMLILGFALRPLGGISKIRATPSWTAICTGISMLFFVLLTYVVDIRKKREWHAAIRPAGTSTLTCYLLPYIHYALFTMVGISLPLFMRTGIAGIFKSLAYALLIITVTGLLEKGRIRLRI
ncbi:MAG: hypothetical protein ABIN89_21935 [Chitinophagaceae bacterium]